MSLICPLSDITHTHTHTSQDIRGVCVGKVKFSRNHTGSLHQGHGGAAGPRRGDVGDPEEEDLAEGELSERLAVGAGHRLYDR